MVEDLSSVLAPGDVARSADKRPAVLLVDDQPARLLTYEAILEGVGVQCMRALSGKEALEKLLQQSFAVILLDVSMPEMDGYETARLIRAHPRFERTPIIFVTGVHVSELDTLRGYEVGAIDYIAVPIVPEILRSKVALLVELYLRRAQLERLNHELEAARSEREQQGELQYRAILEHPTHCMFVFAAVRNAQGQVEDWQYRDANRKALQLLGLSREALLGRRLSELLPQDASQLSLLYAKVLEHKIAEHYEAQAGETHLMMCVYPMSADLIVASGVDITTRLQSDAQVQRLLEMARADKEWLSALVDSMNEEVYFTDTQGRYKYANPAAHQEFQHVSVEGASVKELVAKLEVFRADGTPRPVSEAPPLRALAGEVIRDEEQIVRTPRTGQLRHRQVSSAPVRNGGGEVIGAVSVVRDVTDRRRIEASLRESDERKDAFLATLSHELRNPLGPIRNATTLLSSPNVTEDVRERCLKIISRQVAFMAALLNDLLDVARLTRGELKLKKVSAPLQQIIDDAVETAQPLISEKRLHFAIEAPCPPLTLHADPVRLTQVLGNLLTNACKYTFPGGTIALGCRLAESTLEIWVRDAGIGIAPERLPNLFEMFNRPRSVPSQSDCGLGVGLAIAKALVELHGGRIAVRSEGINCGSTFTVSLPSGVLESHSHLPSSTLAQKEVEDRPLLKILIADDNHDAADTLAFLVQQLGHETHVVYSGQDALATIHRIRPDVALLDVGMPGMSGHEVAFQVRQQPWGRRITLAAITGWGQEKNRLAALSAGFDLHLTKPVNPSVLGSIVESSNRQD